MEKSIANPSSQKPSTSNDVTTSLQRGEKSPSSDVSPAKSPENLEKKVSAKVADIPIAPAHYEALGTEVVSQDDEEEDEITLRLQSSDEDIFEDTVEDVSELIESKTSAGETFFSDIESSDNSQVYEPKSKGTISAEAKKTVSNVCKALDPKGLAKEKSELDFEPVESEEDFEESCSQEEVPIMLQMEEESCVIERKSHQVEEESNATPEAGLSASLSSDKEDSKLNERKKEANKESTSNADLLLENEKIAPIDCEEENLSVMESMDAESDDAPETNYPGGSVPPASPMKSLQSVEASDDSLTPVKKSEILASEREPVQKGNKISKDTEKDDGMEVDTDVKDKVSVKVYGASNVPINEIVESQEVMEADSEEVASIDKHIKVRDDEKSQAQTKNKSLAKTEEFINERKPSNSQKTVEKSANVPEVSNEDEKQAPEHNNILESPIQSSSSLENTDFSVDVQVPAETSIESSNVAEKSEASADLTESETTTEAPMSLSEAAIVTLSSAVKGTEASTEHSTGNQNLVKETEKRLATDTKSNVTVNVIEKSETNQKHFTGAQESLSKVKKTPNAAETSADDTSNKRDFIVDAPTLETAENSKPKDEEDVSLATVKNVSNKPVITANAEKSVEAIKSQEIEQIEVQLTLSDILIDTAENSARAIEASHKDSTVVCESPKKPEKSLDTDEEESAKAKEHISQSARAPESGQNPDGNVDDSRKTAQKLVGNVENSTEVDKSKKLDTDKSPSKSAMDSESNDESSEKSNEENSFEKHTEAETNSSEKPSKCDAEASTEPVAFSIDNSTPGEVEAKVSRPKDAASIKEVVVEEVPADSVKPLAVPVLSNEENGAKQPQSIDPEIIEIDDDDLGENKTKEHATARDTNAAPIESKKDDTAAKVGTEKPQPEEAAALPVEKAGEKAEGSTEKPSNSAAAEKVIESVVEQEVIDKDKTADLKQPTGDATMKAPETASAQAPPDEDESLLMIDTSHKEDNEPDDNDMDTETEQTATSAPTTTDSSSEGSLEIFYDKECLHYECKHGSKNFYRATLFTLNYYKISKKRNKAQYVCEECYDRALSSYEEMCKTLTKKQPLLHGATFKGQEFVEIIDSSEEDDDDDAGDSFKDENVLPKDSIELLEAELEGAIRKVMHNVDIQNQLSWTKQILQQRLNNLQEDTEFVSVQLRQLQKKADNMHNSLYQCPKIKIRQLTPLDLNSGRTYNPETESTIPPMGDVLRTSINVNETYYAVKNKAIASWVPCKVIEAVDNYSPYSKNQKHFKIKFLKSKYPMLKTVSAKHMAFFNPPKVRLPIGTRVIAYFDVTSLSRGKEKMLIPSAFYPGIIAEPLKQSNKFRYLVFYDDGYFQYVYHKDVRLVCQASENVWEDVHHQSREFIHNYLTQYAVNRPMVQTQKGQSMLVDYNGKWIYARVIDVDCSLVQMLFEGQSRSEWIYRGSTRLGPVYKESNSLVQKNQTTTSRISRRTEPFIRYINGDDSSSSQQSQEQPAQPSQPKTGEVRSVAKKSVSKTDNSHQSSQPVPTVRHLNNSTIFVDDDNKPKGKVVYYTARKNLPPRDYEPHICSPTCPFNVTHNLSFYSPLAKPLLSGWERQVFRQKSKKFIVYRGPCGKRLRSMEELHRYLRVTENELNVDNFDFSAETNCLAEYVIESCIVQKKDISNGKEKMPIPCVNYYDNTMPPDCIYSSRRIPTEGVPLNLDKDFLVGCDCEDDCSDKSKCSCWELTYAGAKYGMPNVPNEMVGYQYKRLYEHVPTGIYECNARCKCKANCVNRVVQQPLQSKLQVFKTSNRGWGLRCINDVPRGSFICIYAGHLLNEQKANEGGLDAGDEYFAELDYIEVAEQIKEGYESDVVEPDEDEDLYNPDKEDEDDDEFVAPGESHRNRSFNTRSRSRRSTKNSSDVEHDSQERQVISFEPNKTMGQPDNSTSEKPTIRKLFGKDEACYIMDAKITGNLGRYFNHSCSPNLFVQNVFVDTHDLRFPWVAFFAFTHIRAGTELTWNYNYEVGVVPGKVLYCQCGAPNCRQRLL